MEKRRIGVFICHCGGNISDYVDVESVRKEAEKERDVVVAKTNMFVCSDAAQEEIIGDIQKKDLDGIVIASCSPRLHLGTFRKMAERAGLNPYQYVQVNIREQCSWAHTHNKEMATEKSIRLVRAGVARVRMSKPLTPLEFKTKPAALVIGGGIAGLRAAVSLAEMGISVHLAEASGELGGLVRRWGKMFPNGEKGSEIVGKLVKKLEGLDNVAIYKKAKVTEKTGSVGNFQVALSLASGEKISLSVGAILVATGASTYEPEAGEYGYGSPNVITLPQFMEIISNDIGKASLEIDGREVKKIAFLYCVGSREPSSKENAKLYCSRYCCTAAVHASNLTHQLYPDVEQFHLYRDMRTYGKYELLFHESLKNGSIFVRFDPKDPPQVSASGEGLIVHVKDLLTSGEVVRIEPDLLVLVTGMVADHSPEITDVLKVPVGKDGFLNEIHPKLRPVETVIDGIFIAGNAQGPKTVAESVSSALAAAAKSASLLLPGKIQLEPFVAIVNTEKCSWCGKCEEICPYGAIHKTEINGKAVASVNGALCKGEGACVPYCHEGAIEVQGYTHGEIRAAIKALLHGEEKSAA